MFSLGRACEKLKVQFHHVFCYNRASVNMSEHMCMSMGVGDVAL